jgi:hypothetical protein
MRAIDLIVAITQTLYGRYDVTTMTWAMITPSS